MRKIAYAIDWRHRRNGEWNFVPQRGTCWVSATDAAAAAREVFDESDLAKTWAARMAQIRVRVWLPPIGVDSAGVDIFDTEAHAEFIHPTDVKTQDWTNLHPAVVETMTAITHGELTLREMRSVRADARALVETVEKAITGLVAEK